MKRMREYIPDGFKSRQERRLFNANFASCLGYGMYAPSVVLFLMKIAGISLVLAGTAQTAATVCALLVSVPAGRIVDLVNPRRVAVLSCGLQALLLLAMTVAPPVAVVVIVILQSIANRVMQVALGSVVALLPDSERRTHVSALMQTAGNIGFMIGAVFFSTILTIGAHAAYISCIIVYAATQAPCAALISRIEVKNATGNRIGEPRRIISITAIRDTPYIVTALLCGLLTISDDILIVGIPLWIASHSNIPKIFSASLVALSTGIVAVFQVSLSKAVHSQRTAKRRLRISGILLGAACLLIGASAIPLGMVVAPALLTIGVVVLTVGEMLYSPAKWFLRYDLAQESMQGEYGGVFSLVSGVGAALGPSIIAGLIASTGSWTWPTLAICFIAVGLISSFPGRLSSDRISRKSVARQNGTESLRVRQVDAP